MIEFKNVYIKYIKDFYTLYNCNFKINSNTLVIGNTINANSSIMRIVSKIDRYYKGEVFINNINIKNIKDKDLDLAYVPKNVELFKNKSLFYNLIYTLKIRKINKKTAKNIVINALNTYNLENLFKNYEKTKVKHYNKNLQKLICLLRAVIRKPKYLMLENFLSSLDKDYLTTATNIIKEAENYCTIIACEEDESLLDYYKNYSILNLNI